jgi:two-component system response regulator
MQDMRSRSNSESVIDVLLVEDNPIDADLALKALQGSSGNRSIVVVRDGSEAIDFLFGDRDDSEHHGHPRPRVIFLDLKLPKVSGLEVLERIKSDAEYKLVPIVVLTSSTDIQDVRRSYALGVNSFIVKPIDYRKYAEALSTTCRYWLEFNYMPE